MPGEQDNWIYLGRLYRSAFQALQRLPLRGYPVRRDFPPRVSRDKSFRSSWPEREAMRRVEAEQRFMLTREQVKEALQEIKQWHPELWLAIVLVDVKGMSQGKAADGMGTNPRRVRRLLEAGWAMIAEVIEGAIQG